MYRMCIIRFLNCQTGGFYVWSFTTLLPIVLGEMQAQHIVSGCRQSDGRSDRHWTKYYDKSSLLDWRWAKKTSFLNWSETLLTISVYNVNVVQEHRDLKDYSWGKVTWQPIITIMDMKHMFERHTHLDHVGLESVLAFTIDNTISLMVQVIFTRGS